MTSQGQSSNFPSDDNGQSSFRGKLLTIDSKLGNQDVEGLKFLCRDCISHKNLEKSSSASDIFDHLLAQELLSEEDPFFLAELLYIIKQKSLLRYLNQSKEQVESLLPTRGRVSLFRNLLYELSEGIGSENLKDMIFLLRDSIPKIQMVSGSYRVGYLTVGRIRQHNVGINSRPGPESGALTAFGPDKRNGWLEALNPYNEDSLVSGSTSSSFKEAGVYRMDRKHRGHCVVVNNHTFTSLSNRPGTNTDADHLRHVFEWLGFSVHVYDNVTKGHLDEVLQEYKCHPGHADGDCFVFCVLTHGKFGAVYSSDGTLVPIQEITSHFTAQQCPLLAHKPKLFFIQACQGEEIQPPVFIEADAVNPERVSPSLQDSIPDEADFLLGLATVPGYVSFRHVEEGSWYIQSLCNHLKSLVPRHEDILSILTAVNNDVSQQADRQGTKKQMPQPAFTLRRKLIFPVPQEKLE
ncbi:caspase-10 [Ailuropoda melanoleuca]|uniref:caspase-10 n=1 Tax=Ailuropoda melanoleuca TaxID=9646 RepID=UPI001494FBCE|nr:caspase-10 [Ailuropoda melanoleuca]